MRSKATSVEELCSCLSSGGVRCFCEASLEVFLLLLEMSTSGAGLGGRVTVHIEILRTRCAEVAGASCLKNC